MKVFKSKRQDAKTPKINGAGTESWYSHGQSLFVHESNSRRLTADLSRSTSGESTPTNLDLSTGCRLRYADGPYRERRSAKVDDS